jgi:hypothetical protein
MRLSRKGQHMPREQINTPARRTVSTYLPERPDPTDPTGRTVLEGNGLNPGDTAFGWANDGDRLHDGEHWENTPTLHIGWSAAALDTSMVLYLDVDCDEVLRAAEQIKRLRENELLACPDEWQFSTVVLTRSEVQKLIATTRRARNSVFGADE